MTTYERITYDWAGTRRTVILANPVTSNGCIVGQETGIDGQPRDRHAPLYKIPAVARIVRRAEVDREYFM